MSLTEIGTREVIAVDPALSALEVAGLMANRKVRMVVVADGERPLGILTQRDLAERASNAVEPNARAHDLMSKPLVAVREDADLDEVEDTMRSRELRRLPVIGTDGRLVGIITLDDLVRHYSKVG